MSTVRFALAVILAAPLACGGRQAQPGAVVTPADAGTRGPADAGAVARASAPLVWEGQFHTCVVRSVRRGTGQAAGRVFCWGANGDGELGDGSREDRYAPVAAAAAPDDVVQVSAGLGMTCAVRRNGEVRCWGASYGRVGGAREDAAVPDVRDAVQVSAGGGYACAVSRAGAVRCWGTVCRPCLLGERVDPTVGQCGTRSHCRVAEPRNAADVPGVRDAVSVSTGGSLEGNERDGSWVVSSPCAVLRDGAVVCWDPVAPSARPVGGLPPARQVSTRGRYTVATTLDGAVYQWRSDDARQPPQRVPGLTDVVQASAGWQTACATHTNGEVSCWRPMRTEVTRVEGVSDAQAVMTGAHHQCVLMHGGEVRCWGASDRGFLGTGLRTVQPRPVRIALPEHPTTHVASEAAQLGAGTAYTCARLGDGTVACWGRNSTGTLGRGGADGELPFSPEARRVVGLEGATTLFAGDHHACVLRAGEMLTCWGGNHTGAFGAPPYEYRLAPVDAIALPGVRLLAAGAHRTCIAMARGGEVRCAGNDQGAFRPLDALSGREAPAELAVGPLTACTRSARGALRCSESFATVRARDCTSVAVRTERLCALFAGGRVRCWRLASVGSRWEPREEAEGVVPDGVQIGAGAHHECVRTQSGAVWCRGQNAHGELGDGTRTARDAFVQVVGLASVEEIAVGEAHTCARDGEGAVWCWGNNGDGEIGIMPFATRPEPVVFP